MTKTPHPTQAGPERQRRSGCRRAWPLLVILTLGVLHGCRDAAAPADADDLRIVTLAPAVTQIVVDLELADALVGVAENDDAAPPGLPIVGNFTDVNTEQLVTLRPTHVLIMAGKEGVPQRLHDLAEAGRFELLAYPHLLTVEDIARTVYDPHNPDSVGRVLGRPEKAAAMRQRMVDTLETLRQVTAHRPRPRVLLVIGTNPLMASGPGTVHDELLQYVGAENAAKDAAVTAPTFDRETLLNLDPQVVLVLSPGVDGGARRLPELAGLPIAAVRDDRIVTLSDPLVMLPSTSLPRIAADMARAIHPDLSAAIDEAMAKRADVSASRSERAGESR